MVDSGSNRNVKTPGNSDGRGQENESPPVRLIVDDNDDSREMLKLLLNMWKYRVIEAKDGSGAVALAEKACPDLILMDVKLPDLDGFSVTEKSVSQRKLKVSRLFFLLLALNRFIDKKRLPPVEMNI